MQGGAEEEIGVIEQLGLRGSGQEATQRGDGFFRMTCVDQTLRLVQRWIIRRAS